jgi:hypothetical protein
MHVPVTDRAVILNPKDRTVLVPESTVLFKHVTMLLNLIFVLLPLSQLSSSKVPQPAEAGGLAREAATSGIPLAQLHTS